MQIVDLDRVSAQRPGEDGWGQRDRLFNDERRRERDIEDRLEHRGHGGGGGSAGPITLDPVVVHAPQPPPPQPQPAPPPPIVDLPPVTALPPDGPLPSYGDLLAERREQRRYATDEEYRQFWRGEQQRILQFGLGPVMDAIDMVRAPFQGRWRDTLLNVLSLFGGGAASKLAMATFLRVGRQDVLIRNASLAGQEHPITKIPFDADGFPDFSKVAIKEVKIVQKGTRADFREADKAAGLDRRPEGFSWHHHQDGRTMQLVPSNIHDATAHTGGSAIQRAKIRQGFEP